MLPVNLFCGPANCIQCVENTDLNVQHLKVMEHGKLENGPFDMMDEMLLESSPMDYNRNLEVSEDPPVLPRRNLPTARQRSFSAKDLRHMLKELDREPPSLLSGRKRQEGNHGEPSPRYQNFLSPRPAAPQTAYDEKYWQTRYLDCMLAVGDVLAVADRRQITRIGGTGGIFGHVLVVTAVPRCIMKHTPEAFDFLRVWPAGRVREIYQVPVMECTRANEGIHETDLVLYVHPKSCRIVILGEVDSKGEVFAYENPFGVPEEVELWQCPPELRDSSCRDLKEAVIDEMKENQVNWSWATAVRAFLLPAQVESQYLAPSATCGSGRQQLLKEVQECWKGAPICTSLPIIFWQRYLYKFSQSGRASEAPLNTMSPIDMIMMYMPLKADRALPGELLKFLRTSGWTNIQVLPTQKPPFVNHANAVPKGHSR